MHQTVFLGWGLLVSLAAIIGLSTHKKIDYVPLMTAFTLSLGAAMIGGFLFGILISGQPSVSSLGAIFGGGFAIYLTLHFFRPKPQWESVDVLVSSTFLGLLVTRVGCITNQCDFGSPTDFFWGMSYEMGPIWQYHRAIGISEGLQSHAVHPFPWMIILPSALLFVFVWARNLERKTEWIVYGYLAVRFFAEFFRDESTSVSIGGVQLGLLASGVVFGFVHRWYKKQHPA